MSSGLGPAVASLIEVCRDRQRDDLAERLETELARAAVDVATIVVVGETNRGKSTLINALLGRELLPASLHATTSAYVVAGAAAAGADEQAIVHHRDGTATVTDLSALAPLITGGADSVQVAHVELSLHSDWLDTGVLLVDTPGTGGLDASHAAVTRAALMSADALVFVLDPEAPISRTEVAFLESVTDRVATTVFVLTKIDEYAGWETILGASRARLPERFRDAPILAVSSTQRLQAIARDADGDVARAARLHERSGFAPLFECVRESVLERRAHLAAANVCRLCNSVVDELRLLDSLASATDDEDLQRRLREVHAEAQEFDEARKRWSGELTDAFEQLRISLTTQYDRAVLELERAMEARIADADAAMADTLPDELQAAFDGISGDLNCTLIDGLVEIDTLMVKSLGTEVTAVLAGLEATVLPRVVRETLPDLPGPSGAESTGVRQTQAYLLGGLGGSRIAALPALVGIGLNPIGAAALAVVGAVGGVGVARALMRQLDKGGTRMELQRRAQRLVQDASRSARIEILNPALSRLSSLRRHLAADMSDRLERKSQELREAIRHHSNLSVKDRARLQAEKRRAQDRLVRLDEIRASIETARAA